ncbi:TetR/AcrR family transcriptional regulator [Lysinibacillus xylanilyticus]|uniref:TetR/AcrR family transcriptional regulator n=1 Tax=Lysinibacillus TaxID=400634 RepID=UPI002B25627C|nr:TetR/AcrR family transcriptional regulator [Lysinibacillus xylanilyticus]MEB2301692.1 TetR/AcrR family transcriptional regulator [Lysinibacillus xylanilyticus]
MDKRERTRAQILVAAKNVFLANGYKETTIKLIAKEAGLGYGTIYSHFNLGKEEVLATLVEDVMSPFYKIAELNYTPKNKQEAFNFTFKNIYNYLSLAVENKEIFRLIHEAKGVSPLIGEKWESITDQFIRRVSANVEIVRQLGLIRNENYHAEVIASSLYYIAERYLWKIILDKTDIPIEEIARDVATMYTFGLFK